MNPKGNGIDTLKWEKTTCVFFVLVGVEHHWKKNTHTHIFINEYPTGICTTKCQRFSGGLNSPFLLGL